VSETRIYRIEKGSMVVIPHSLDEVQIVELQVELQRVAGHDRFLVMLEPPGGDVEVLGPADIIAELAEQGIVGSGES